MIGIIGGGLAGLGAAYRLRQAGVSVRVYEANDRLGGLAHSHETAGDPIEAFYHHLSRSEETIVEVIEEVGLGDALEWRVGKNAYYVDGVVHPLDTLWQIGAYPHLSLLDKVRLGLLTLDISMQGGYPTFNAFDDLEAYDDVPVTEFILQHTSRGVYRSFFEPLLRAKFGDRMDDVSAAWLLGRIKFRSERDLRRGEILGYLEGGFQQLTNALVDEIGRTHIETGTAVREIKTTDEAESTVTDLVLESGQDTRSEPVDGVIVATMPHVLEMLTGYECGIDFQGTVCSLLSLEEPLTGTYWLNIADDAPFGALIEHTNFVPPSRYGDEHLLYVARYVQDLEGAFWQQETAAIEAQWLDGIESMFPSFSRDHLNWIETARNPRTAPVYEQGYLEQVVPYDLSESVADGVYYAGMASRAQYPERSLNGALEAGFAAAEAALESRN